MEVQKELRLPIGFKSWFEVLNVVPDQDELPLWKQNTNLKYYTKHEPSFWGSLYDSKEPSEVFECDILTLKVRAFDELRELIPDKRVLTNMIYAVNAMGYVDPDGMNPIREFLQKLINLT